MGLLESEESLMIGLYLVISTLSSTVTDRITPARYFLLRLRRPAVRSRQQLCNGTYNAVNKF